MAKAYHPDDSGLLPPPTSVKKTPVQSGVLSSFLPGQQDALAQQLNQGFGGGVNNWTGILSNWYAPQPNAVKYLVDERPSVTKTVDDKKKDKDKDKPNTPVYDDKDDGILLPGELSKWLIGRR